MSASSRAARAGCAAVAFAAFAAEGVARAGEVVVLDRPAVALGSGWDREHERVIGPSAACVTGGSEERRAAPEVRYSLLVLSRAAGQLRVGVHVGVDRELVVLEGGRVTDAARRLARADPAHFRALCGDGFVGALRLGGSYVAEIEFLPPGAAATAAWISRSGYTGTWREPEPFREALEAIAVRDEARPQELPGGWRSRALPLDAAELVDRALGFPERLDEADVEPYLATVVGYDEAALAGRPIAVEAGDPSAGAAGVFLRGRRFRGPLAP